MALDRALITRLMYRQEPPVPCYFTDYVKLPEFPPEFGAAVLTRAARGMRSLPSWTGRAREIVGFRIRGYVRRKGAQGMTSSCNHAHGEFEAR